jgi:SAM-dependent methyltransferase
MLSTDAGDIAVEIFPISPSESLEPSGERYTSAAGGEVKHEQYHRYFFALQFCDKKEVLDVGSDEGYGSALLGTLAQQVLGIELSPEAVARASRNYGSERVSFTVGDYAAIPLSDASVDVVVSFETLEHVADLQKFFSEIKRILRPDGMLVISTPNAKVYKDLATRPKPSQVKELDADEFRAILSEHFSNYRLLGQRPVIGSAIAPDSSLLSDRHQTFRAADSGEYSVHEGIGRPTYLIAVASETALPEIRHGLLDYRPFLRNLYDLLEKRAIAIREIEQQLRATVTIRDELQEKLRSRESELSEVDKRLSQLSRELQSRDDELAQSRALVAGIQSSGSRRMTLPLRFLRHIAEAIRRRSVRLADRLGVRGLFGHRVLSNGTNSKAREAHLPLPLEAAKRLDAAPTRVASGEPETESQILQRSGLFDEKYYCEANPDVGTTEISPLEHYLSVGGFEGRRPNRLFDSAYYLATYSDVAKAGINPALHYFLNGALEGRDPSAEFDTSYYLEANPDVVASGINPLVHFLRFGAALGRLPLKPETEMEALQRFLHQEVRGLHESIGSLRAIFLSEKLSRAEVGYDVVITPNEVNYQHGTGFLVDRLFRNRANILSIRAANHYGGDHHFGDESLLITHEHPSRPRSIEQTLRNLGGRIPKRIFCVPFLSADLLTAITLCDVFKAPLCLYLMDDQNITTPAIPDSLMQEFLDRCALRLTTHSEMRDAYESKYGRKFYLLPAVVPARLISTSISQPELELVSKRTGALVGSIWGRAWWDRLKTAICDSGLACHWFGNHKSPIFPISAEDLAKAGIHAQGVVSEEVLAHQLRRFPFAIVPTGTLDENDDAAWASALSLPGRILFILATSNTPIILMGSSKTPAARLIEHFRIGVRCDYTAESFLLAVHRVIDPKCQAEMRTNAVRIAPNLSAEGIGEWIDRSLELGRACDDRFEQLMPT